MVRLDDFGLFVGGCGGHLLQLHELASWQPFEFLDSWGTWFRLGGDSLCDPVALATRDR